MTKVRMKEDAGWCDGQHLLTGRVIDMTPTAAADYISKGKAEPVDEPEPVIETAEAAPPENAAKRTGKPKPRRKG